MSAKTIFLLVITVALTVILMKNTYEIQFWLFGDTRLPLLGILGCTFALGLFIGFMLGRPGKKSRVATDLMDNDPEESDKPGNQNLRNNSLSDEDREYIN